MRNLFCCFELSLSYRLSGGKLTPSLHFIAYLAVLADVGMHSLLARRLLTTGLSCLKLGEQNGRNLPGERRDGGHGNAGVHGVV